jgi:Ca2+-binding EF-hand superfamily protein
MDKFAVLQLKKKRAREAEAKAKGHIVGDVLNAEKQKLSREDLEKMSRNFGYMDPPTACYAIGKDAQAAVWWAWTNPLPPYYPEPLSDDEEEEEKKDKDSDDDEDEEHKEAPPVEEAKGEEEPAEEEDDEPEFDEEGNVIIKGPTKAQLEAKRLRKEAKAAAKAERERVRAEKLLDGSAKVKIKCDGCGKRFKIGTKSCNKCFRALKQPDLEEIARIEAEAKAEAEAKLAEVARLAQEKAEFRKQRREAQREEMNKRVKGFVINRYRKDPFRGDSSSARGDALAGRSASPPRSSKGGPSPAFGAKHASHNDESAAAGISMYSSDSPVIPHYSEDDAEADEMGVWRKKGTFFFEFGQDSKDKMQIILDELPNNYEYRFTVSVMNGFGTGIESAPSNVVMIETPLPAGWNRFFSDEKKAFYYANLKLNLALWRRPDLDPYFLEESILQLFNNAEVTYLKGLYDEEMMHFQWIIVDRFIDVLSEVGEKMSKYRIIKLFDGYASNNYKFKEWRFFMDIFFHIKKRKMQGSLMGQVAAAANIGAMVKRQAVASILGESEGKMGDWIIEYSNIADREFYRNKKTKVTSWDMPDEIRFFLPGKLEAKLLRVFDYGHIETFKQYYSMLDVDNSGDLSDLEIKRLLNALGVQITPDGLAKLVETVDLNGNGTIEFDEFCWMMYEMSRTDGEGELSGLQGKIPSMAPPMDSVRFHSVILLFFLSFLVCDVSLSFLLTYFSLLASLT